MQNIKHYLITMFNLRLKWGGIARTDDIGYLRKRFDLFEKYTLPSLEAQTCKEFEWIVLFSSATPPEFLGRIDSYRERMPNFKPLFIDDEKAPYFREKLVEYIKKDSSEIVVTTRCDNDDVLSKFFVQKIHENLDGGSKYVLSFPNGYQLDVATRILRKYYFPNSHFTTYVSTEVDKTIYDFLHMEIFDKCDVRLLKEEPLWIEVIHEGNVYNTMGSIHYSDYIKKYDLWQEFHLDIRGDMNAIYLFFMYIYFALHKLYVKKDRIAIYIARKLKKY